MKDQHDSDGRAPATTAAPRPRETRANRAFSRRAFLRLAGAAAATVATSGVSLAACSPATVPATTEGSAKVQLVYQDWRTEWFPAMAQQMLGEFHATHPNIRVFYVPDPENLPEQMLSDMQAGTAADVFQGCCSHFPIWAQMGYTLDLRPYVKADLDKATIEDWDPIQYKALFTADGRQFGVPKYHGALALYYNKDILDEYKVDYPDGSWTFADYLTALGRLTADSNDDGRTDVWGSMVDISWDRLQVYVNSWGGHFVDPADPTRCRMAEPEALAAFEWLRARMVDEKVMATLLDTKKMGTSDSFVAGRLAMVEDGSWALKSILTGARFRVGVAPFPTGPARHASLASTDGFGIYAKTKHPEAAWELVKFLIGKDYGRAMARAHFLQPARASLVDEWAGFVREQFPDKARDMDIAAFADGHIKGYSVTTETFASMADATRIAGTAWDQIFTYGEAPVEHMREVSRQIDLSQQKGTVIGGPCC